MWWCVSGFIFFSFLHFCFPVLLLYTYCCLSSWCGCIFYPWMAYEECSFVSWKGACVGHRQVTAEFTRLFTVTYRPQYPECSGWNQQEKPRRDKRIFQPEFRRLYRWVTLTKESKQSQSVKMLRSVLEVVQTKLAEPDPFPHPRIKENCKHQRKAQAWHNK